MGASTFRSDGITRTIVTNAPTTFTNILPQQMFFDGQLVTGSLGSTSLASPTGINCLVIYHIAISLKFTGGAFEQQGGIYIAKGATSSDSYIYDNRIYHNWANGTSEIAFPQGLRFPSGQGLWAYYEGFGTAFYNGYISVSYREVAP